MSPRTPHRFVATILGTSLVFACAVAAAHPAQDVTSSAAYRTPEGEVDVRSGPNTPKDFGPPPAFAALARHGGAITSDDASAYPPLANDFIYADSNRDGRISRSEYERWAKVR